MEEQTGLTTESMDLFADVTESDISEMTENEAPQEDAKPSETEDAEDKKDKDQTTEEGTDEALDAKPSDESYTLTHLGKEVKLSREELIRTAQKGLDYDRVRGSYDRIEGLARKSGQSVNDFLAALNDRADEAIISKRTQELLETGEFSENSARQMAQMEQRIKAQEKAEQERTETESRQNAFREAIGSFVMNNPEFMKEFPDAQLPADMIADLNNGMDINGAWARHQLTQERKANEEMKKQLAGYEQSRKNKQNAAPSIKSEDEKGAKDPFLEGLMMGRW